MKKYTPDNPQYSETIDVVETTDPVHADVVNSPFKQLQDNSSVMNSRTQFWIGTDETLKRPVMHCVQA